MEYLAMPGARAHGADFFAPLTFPTDSAFD
jgi:hypothetical protein